MKTKVAYSILNMELSDGINILSGIERENLLDEARRKYHTLLKTAHPDVKGEIGGISAAHNQTIELNEAFQIVKNSLVKRRLTVSEWFAMGAEKRRLKREQQRAERKGQVRLGNRSKKILQYSRNGEFIKEWPSISLAAKTLHIYAESISRNANRNKYRSAGGFVWKFKT